MAEQFGIRLTVSSDDLAESINTALRGIKPEFLDKVKIGVDTTEIENAIKK